MVIRNILYVSLFFLAFIAFDDQPPLQVNSSSNDPQIDEQILNIREELNHEILRLNDEVNRINQIVEHLPDVKIKQGYIHEVMEDESGLYLMIDFAEMIRNDGISPNNFHIENESDDLTKVEAVDDVELYVLDSTNLVFSPLEEIEDKLSVYPRLFNLYFVGDRLVLATEQYLP